MSGPLQGFKVVEFAGLGPGPFAGMLLADLGAQVVCVDRVLAPETDAHSIASKVLRRNKQSISLNLKQPEAIEAVLRLIASADVLIEGFRPGVMEKLGLSPEVCLARHPKLVYGRMTGWGQTGPLAQAAGHDINYIALSSALHTIGTPAQPLPPLNLVGDFGGGGMLLVAGVLAAALSARATGKGQVVDAAMTDGSALLMGLMYARLAEGQWRDERGQNMLDGAAHFYGTYLCADGKWIALGSIEPQFYALLIQKSGLSNVDQTQQRDPASWPAMRQQLELVFATRTRQEWCEVMEGTDVCFAPVLSMTEAPLHPHNVARQTFCEVQGVLQPSVAPRFSHTPTAAIRAPVPTGAHTVDILRQLGYSASEIEVLQRDQTN
ncbi:MAG: carnitine dehydratase [Alcaligenaceae bacterium]|nr:MAG: carnitine dehydratase [Alcaligenaceae bacterium]